MRVDLMELLADLNPSFLRCPGGNNLEGNDPPYFWNWTETIGPLKDRRGRPGTWGYENTNGLGLVEYMEWCTDLNMEPGTCRCPAAPWMQRVLSDPGTNHY
jgi:alpha-N-arabinofuranosidase